VGGSLARAFNEDPQKNEVVLFDNLSRSGSEWNIKSLVSVGAKFVHGDVRNKHALEALEGNFDVLIEASAEASVQAGISGSPRNVFETNLVGALNCLEFARERCGAMIFLSSSRVYAIEALKSLPLVEAATRFELDDHGFTIDGAEISGITENFSCDGPRSYYGASKLAAEMLCQEYEKFTDLDIVVNRCGVIAGPGQFGKTDQGVFTLWVARHYYGRPLCYTGFGGKGLQVRDLLHPDDLFDLVRKQLASWDRVTGRTFNIGGGYDGSVSLKELTTICEETVGRSVQIGSDNDTNPVDMPWYVSDHTNVTNTLGWKPRHGPQKIVSDINDWIRKNENALSSIIV